MSKYCIYVDVDPCIQNLSILFLLKQQESYQRTNTIYGLDGSTGGVRGNWYWWILTGPWTHPCSGGLTWCRQVKVANYRYFPLKVFFLYLYSCASVLWEINKFKNQLSRGTNEHVHRFWWTLSAHTLRKKWDCLSKPMTFCTFRN